MKGSTVGSGPPSTLNIQTCAQRSMTLLELPAARRVGKTAPVAINGEHVQREAARIGVAAAGNSLRLEPSHRAFQILMTSDEDKLGLVLHEGLNVDRFLARDWMASRVAANEKLREGEH